MRRGAQQDGSLAYHRRFGAVGRICAHPPIELGTLAMKRIGTWRLRWPVLAAWLLVLGFSPVWADNAKAQPAPLLRLQDRHLVAGEAVHRYQKGETVHLRFVSDQKVELHLHGYDIVLKLQPDQMADLRFVAQHAGRFEFELHGHGKGGHAALGAIEIYP